MVDPIAQSMTYLRQAQRSDLSLTLRLRAISAMAQAIDRFCQGEVNGSTSAPSTGEPLPVPQHLGSNELNATVLAQLQAATQLVNHQLIPLLRRQHILLPAVEQLGEQQRDWLFDYFKRRIHPLLTPLAVDPGHPFPYISNESLNLLVLLQRPGGLA